MRIKSLRKIFNDSQRRWTVINKIGIFENEIKTLINAVNFDTDNENDEQKHSQKTRRIE